MGVVPALGVNFSPVLEEPSGSFLGENFILEGELAVLLLGPALFSSSFLFIVDSLELLLIGACTFLGDGLITFSEVLRLTFVTLLASAAASPTLFLGVVLCFSSAFLRA